MRVSARAIIALACASGVACALVTDLSGLEPSDASTACDASGACAVASLPARWTPIAYHEGFVGCPSGFVSQKYVTKVTASCACGCDVTTEPTCDVGSVATSFGDHCQTPGASVNVDGGCTAISGALGTDFEATPLAPSSGKCTPTSTPNTTTVTAEACVPATCGDAICDGIVPQGYKACVLTTGEVACPMNTPFTVATTVGTSASAVCAGCTCTMQVTCTSPTIAFFKDPACATPVVTLPADGTCATNVSAATIGSAKYTADAGVTCDAGGTNVPTISFTESHTVCCAP